MFQIDWEGIIKFSARQVGAHFFFVVNIQKNPGQAGLYLNGYISLNNYSPPYSNYFVC